MKFADETQVTTLQLCPIKKEFLTLQERMEMAKQNLNNTTSLDCYERSVKLDILKEAGTLSNEILDSHDRNKECICFDGLSSENEEQPCKTDQICMLTHLEKLKKMLGQVDHHVTDVHQSETKASVPKTQLNPLSKCFVPSSKVFQIVQKCEPKLDDAQGVGQNLSIETCKKDPSLGCPNEENMHQPDNLISVQEHLNKPTEYNLKPEIRNLWPKNRKIGDNLNFFPSLMTCFYGLNRHEESFCPTASPEIAFRTNKFKTVWSVGAEDRKLWNESALDEPCGCPPCFGYNIPPEFFGNPLNLPTPCRMKGVHMSHYTADKELDSKSENNPKPTDILQNPNCPEFSNSEMSRNIRLHSYKNSFQQFVEEICSMAKVMENHTDFSRSEDFPRPNTAETQASLCEDHPKEMNTVSKQDGILEPSLPILSGSKETNLTKVCKLPKRDYLKLCENRIEQICDPPCSIWCDSKWLDNKQTSSQKSKNSFLSRQTRHHENCSNAFESFSKTARWASSSSIACVRALRETSTIFDTEHWNTWKLAEFRMRRDSGDSGYSSVSSSLSQAEHEIKFPLGCGRDTFIGCGDDLSNSWFENDYWTPLPDCKPSKDNQKYNSHSDFASFDQRLAKQRRTRLPRSYPVNFRDIQLMRKNQNISCIDKDQENMWRENYDQNYPILKQRCKMVKSAPAGF